MSSCNVLAGSHITDCFNDPRHNLCSESFWATARNFSILVERQKVRCYWFNAEADVRMSAGIV